MMMINRRRVCGGESLPYDAEVEYLQCTGTQYIDLGFKATNNIWAEIVFYRPNNNVRFDCGAEDGWSSKIVRCIIIENDNVYYRNHVNSPSNVYGYSVNYVGKIKIVINNRTATVTNLSTGSALSITNNATTSFTTTENFILCGIMMGTELEIVSQQSGMRIISVKIVDNGVNLDLIPVRIGQFGYLYDKVSGQLFGNSGTGSFILGPDV